MKKIMGFLVMAAVLQCFIINPASANLIVDTGSSASEYYVMSQYQFNYTIKFVAFSGEEQGLLGSEVYAQEAFSQGWNIEGVLNCDMISYAVTTSDGNNVKVYENTASEWLYTYTVNIGAEYNQYIRLTLHHAGTSSGSDHYYFWQRGYLQSSIMNIQRLRITIHQGIPSTISTPPMP